jgi:Kdo2-lipid IVA lauroyltransferase/acyltransferase
VVLENDTGKAPINRNVGRTSTFALGVEPIASKKMNAPKLSLRRRLVRLRKRYLPFLPALWRPIASTLDFALAFLVRRVIRLLKRLDPDASSDFAGTIAKKFGPFIPTSRVARKNLRLAFPEKSAAEIEEIVRGVWENLGRVAGEFIHLEAMWDYDHARPNAGRIETNDAEKFGALRDGGKPALIFTAHLANWELAAVCAAAHGLDAAILFRAPENRFVGEIIHEVRAATMGQLLPAGILGTLAMTGVLERGGHVGMLVDQHREVRRGGVPVKFFGRTTPANSTIMRLARQFDCAVHGVRVIRLPRNRFRVELTDPIALARDEEGRIDIQPSMQIIMSVIEGWIREHPEQWLWLHRRWRDGD